MINGLIDIFTSLGKYILFLFLGAIFNSFAGFYGVNYTASKKTIGAFSTSMIAAVVKILTILLLIKSWGIQAASFSTMLAYFAMWMVRIFHTKKLVNVQLNKNQLFISSTLVLAQAILLLVSNATFYITQIPLVLIVVFAQRKYFKQILRFGKSLVNTKNKDLV